MSRSASSPSAAEPVLHVDRSGAEREDDHLLDRVLTDPRTRVLAVRRDAAPLTDGRLLLVGVDELRVAETAATKGVDELGEAAAVAVGVDDFQAETATAVGVNEFRGPGIAATKGVDELREAETATTVGVDGDPDVREWAFLGRDGEGAAIVLAVLADDAPDPFGADATWAPLRAAGGDLAEVEAELLTTAVALAGWLRDAPFCPACGARTQLRHAGWSRHCPACGREHFPRTDPAVIVLVTSARSDDRILLGANAAWAGRRYSCFAGFAEAGESLEDAVAREVEEEAGVRLRDIAYRSSQAWPYPRSLMLGFRAAVIDDDDARPDGQEIVEVRWFTRDEIGAALRGEADVQLPGAASIARRLIDDWYRGVA